MFTNGFSQKNEKGQEVDMVMHRVELGETIRLISKKFLVSPSDIYAYNKFATEGISEGMILYIPVPKKEIVYTEKEEVHQPEPTAKKNSNTEKEVVTKEVVTKEVEVKKEVVKEEVPKEEVPKEVVVQEVSNEKKEDVPKVSSYPVLSATVVQSGDVIDSENPNIIKHTVQKQETLYGLSKIYNVTLDELKEQNKTILKNGLQIGQVLTIKKSN